jgi:protoporphyrinogen oxidase
MKQNNIGIIGGGLSGLTAAHSLIKSKEKINITVIEKNSEIGGRILTKKFDNCSIELGAQFFIEGGEVHKIIDKLKLKPIIKLSENNFFSFYNGKEIKSRIALLNSNNLNEIKELKILFDKAKKFSICQDLISCSFEEWYKKNIGKSTLDLCNRILMSMGFRDTKSINACFGLTLINALFNRNNYLLKEGLTELVNKLAVDISNSGGEIITNANCLSIDSEEKKFNIKMRIKGKIIEKKFDKLISTINPEDLINIYNFKMVSQLKNIRGHSLKMFIIKINKKLWRDTWGLVINKKDCPIYLICDLKNVTNYELETPLLCVCSSNINKYQLISELKELFGNNLIYSIIHEKKWDIGLHQPDENFFIIRKKIKEKLPKNFYLAGDWMSLPALEGAVISGLKAAESVKIKIK